MKKIFLLLVTVFFVSCGMPTKSELIFEEPGSFALNPDTQVTYEMIKSKILNSKCLSCHSSVSTESGLKGWISPGNPQASPFFLKTENGSMPKNGSPLSTGELELIRLYITQMASPPGAPAPNPAPSPAPDGTNPGVTFAEIKSKILDEYNCTGCHSMSTEDRLAKWINTSKPSESKFYTMTKSGAMPEDGPNVSREDLDLILQYVKDFSDRN